ncbi:MAG: DMT family transporter [Burkholderiaceae bacterium]
MSPRTRSALLLAFAATCWSIAGVLTRQLTGVGGFEVTFWRSLFCAVTMVAILGWQQRGSPLAPLRAAGAAGLVSGAMWAVMFTCFMLALTRTSVANTLLVMSLAPLLTALLGRVVLGARLTPATWTAVLLAGVGIGWMVHDGVSADGLAGMAIALAVPIASAINIVVLKRLHAHVDLAPAILTGAVLSCLATAPFAWPFAATANDLLILAVLGAGQLAIPCFLMIRAVRNLASHEVALIALLEVVLGPLWAWGGAGEAIPAATLQGGLIVLVALAGNELIAARSARMTVSREPQQPIPPATGPA